MIAMYWSGFGDIKLQEHVGNLFEWNCVIKTWFSYISLTLVADLDDRCQWLIWTKRANQNFESRDDMQ